jgi:hypothetical protein
MQIILQYSARTITMEEDTLFAVVGALQPVALKLGGGLVQGLPIGAWDIAISFQNSRERPLQAWRPWSRKSNFPSWSWAGWTGTPHWKWMPYSSSNFTGPAENFLRNNTWITWLVYHHGKRVPLDLASETSTKDAEILEQGPAPGMNGATLATIRAKKQFPQLRISPLLPLKYSVIAPYPFLLFCSVSVHLHLAPWRTMDDEFGNPDNLKRISFSRYGFEIGLDELVLRDQKGRPCGKLRLDTNDFDYDNTIMELVLLSEISDWGFEHPFLILQDKFLPTRRHSIASQRWRLRIRGNLTDAPDWMVCDAYWVMLVQRKGNVYERRGHGAVVKAAVDASFPPGPQWKEFLLA